MGDAFRRTLPRISPMQVANSTAAQQGKCFGSPVDLSSTSEEAFVKTSLVMGSQKRASWVPAFLVLGSCASIHQACHPLQTKCSCVQWNDAPSNKQR